MRVLLLLPLTGFLFAAPVTEESVEHAAARFRIVRAAPEQVRVVWKDEKDVPYRTFDKVQAAFTAKGKTVRFIMNGGIFEPGGIPSGLHIENGKLLHPLNLADAPGNFFLKPNGVVWIEKNQATITTADSYERQTASRAVQTAVQSGPQLLIAGKRHPAFRDGSPNKLHRNGVGVDDKGRLVFAMTDRTQYVNLWDFAGLFLKLGCRNALFLDGDISQMAVNPLKPVESNRFGAIFVIAE